MPLAPAYEGSGKSGFTAETAIDSEIERIQRRLTATSYCVSHVPHTWIARSMPDIEVTHIDDVCPEDVKRCCPCLEKARGSES